MVKIATNKTQIRIRIPCCPPAPNKIVAPPKLLKKAIRVHIDRDPDAARPVELAKPVADHILDVGRPRSIASGAGAGPNTAIFSTLGAERPISRAVSVASLRSSDETMMPASRP